MPTARNAIRLLTVFGLAAAVAVQCLALGSSARDKLLYSMRRHAWSVSAIITQSQPDLSYPFQHQVKIELSPDGRSRQTILHPLSLQGIVSVDDGTTLRTLYPNQKVLVYQSSPYAVPEDADLRIALTERNYKLSL